MVCFSKFQEAHSRGSAFESIGATFFSDEVKIKGLLAASSGKKESRC